MHAGGCSGDRRRTKEAEIFARRASDGAQAHPAAGAAGGGAGYNFIDKINQSYLVSRRSYLVLNTTRYEIRDTSTLLILFLIVDFLKGSGESTIKNFSNKVRATKKCLLRLLK